jgi:hypothetical protein
MRATAPTGERSIDSMAIESKHDRYYRLVSELSDLKRQATERFHFLREKLDRAWNPEDDDLMFFDDVIYSQLWDRIRMLERQTEQAKAELKKVLNTRPDWIASND